jgi:hypothetical protein
MKNTNERNTNESAARVAVDAPVNDIADAKESQPQAASSLSMDEMKAKFKKLFAEAAPRPDGNVQSASAPEIRVRIVCPRKAYPQLILFQLEPVLRKLNLVYGVQVLGLFADLLKAHGITIRECPLDIENPLSGELSFYDLTSEDARDTGTASPPPMQTMRASEVIRWTDGSDKQAFSLEARGHYRVLPIKAFFIPDDNSYHIGTLVECEYDRAEGVWRATGKTKSVAAPWNENSLADNNGDDARNLGDH